MTRKRKTRTGNNSRVRSAFAAALLLLLCAVAVAAEKKAPPSHAVVRGTVFRDSGMSLPGAQVTIAATGDSKEARKFKKMTMETTPRGEFVFRLPAGPMNYVLTASASGYQPQEKPVAIAGEERIDVFFRLEPASK